MTVETPNVAETKEVVQPQNTQVVEKVETTETPEQINWKKFREARESDRKAKEASDKRAEEKAAEAAALKAAMEAILNKPVHQQQNNFDEDESEDQRIQKKVDAALVMREQQLEQQRYEREQKEFPQKLAETYRDFHEVCNASNLDYLEYHYPEVARAFKHQPESFNKWSDIYSAVKRFVPNTDTKKDERKAEKNFNKPQSMAAAGVTQTGDTAPVQLDEKRRTDNWARMQRVMKGGR